MLKRDFIVPIMALAAICLATTVVWAAVWVNDATPNQPKVITIAALSFACVFIACLWAWRKANTQFGAPEMTIKAVCCVVSAATVFNVTNQIARVFQIPPPTASGPTTLNVVGTDIHLTEVIDFKTYDKFGSTLSAHPTARRLILDSNGGRIPAARGLARLVHAHQLETHVDGVCASACTVVFIAGQKRTIGPDGKLGFHGYRLLSTVETLNMADEQQRDIAEFTAQGVDPNFLQRALTTPHDTMWFPTRPELVAAGLLTDPTN